MNHLKEMGVEPLPLVDKKNSDNNIFIFYSVAFEGLMATELNAPLVCCFQLAEDIQAGNMNVTVEVAFDPGGNNFASVIKDNGCEQTFLHGILKNINGSTLSHGVKESLISFHLSMIVDPAIDGRKFVDTGSKNKSYP